MVREPHDPARDYLRKFGKRLRARREEQGFRTYAEFADAIGIAHETYRLYEAGLRGPKLHVLARISVELKTSLDYLVLGKHT